MKDFLNYDEVYDTFLSLFKETVEDYGMDYASWEAETEEYAAEKATETLEDMTEYVHKKDTSLLGNFCNIREDWEYCPEFIGSEVNPWGKFDDVIKSIDNETISDEDLRRFQTWALDWFFRAFGTYNLAYNFGNWISDLEYERQLARTTT